MHGLDQRNFRAVKALKARVPKLEEAQFGQAEPSRFSKHNIGDEVLAQHPNSGEEKKATTQAIEQEEEGQEYEYDVWFPSEKEFGSVADGTTMRRKREELLKRVN
ncbi:hypothetical protein IFR04_010119 [Cadophora malorum]|uniref:Uncharacterized protein n=1 Tax=Cadophora malorum TaxID=108018 RepID=A0A8H7TCN4_9HELO|nr:hypothetical protein IFR04_010119 [Cadophora malorum]